MMPSRRSSGVRREMRKNAPRILKDPVSCVDSSFKDTGTSRRRESTGEGSRGVRRMRPFRNAAASTMRSCTVIDGRFGQDRRHVRDRVQLHPFDGGMGSAAGRSHDYGFDAGGVEKSRVHPRSVAHVVGSAAEGLGGCAVEGADYRSFLRNFKGISDEKWANRGLERGVGGAEATDDLLKLADYLCFGFAGDRPAFDLEFAGCGVGAQAFPALDRRGVERRRAYQRMRRALTQVAFERVEFSEKASH